MKNMPSDKKRIFSLVAALVLTVLIITIWLSLDNYFLKKDEVKDIKSEDGINQLVDSIKSIFTSSKIGTSTADILNMNVLNATSTKQQ